jgi:hypothetical protein
MGHMHHRLSGSNPQDTADMAQAKQSLKKPATLTFAQAVFGHGDPLAQDTSAVVVPLARPL